MAGLNDLSSLVPAGTETPTMGSSRIRAIIAKVKEWAGIEHSLAGPHTFLHGPLSSRPAAGYEGRIYILEEVGLAKEIQKDTGSAWETITANQDIATLVADLASHVLGDPLPHADGSVTAAKILAGAIVKKHLEGGVSIASIAALVNGGSADDLHTHPQYVTAEQGEYISPEDLTSLTEGDILFGSAPTEREVTSTYYTEIKKIQTKRAGTFKIKFYMTSDGETVKGRIYKNGSPVGTERIISGVGAETYTETLSGFAVDDLIQLYAKKDTALGYCSVALFNIYAQWDMETLVD